MPKGKRRPGGPTHIVSKAESKGGSAAGVTKVEPRLPGMTGGNIKEIDQAGAALLDVQERKKAIIKEEKTANDVVVAVMKKRKKDYYSYDQLEVWLEPGKMKAKAKHKEPKKAKK